MPRHFPADVDPTKIGTISAPPFARLPDPETLFAERAERLRFLASGSDLGPYLLFVASIADAQGAILAALPDPDPIPPEHLAQAREHAMPPLRRAGLRRDAALAATFDALFDRLADAPMPAPAATALATVRGATSDAQDAMVADVLADAIPFEAIAEHGFVAAALQVHFARLAARLDPAGLVPVGDALCPACGGQPVASLVVGWPGAESTRFCACPLCASLWHYVRIRCTACGTTKGVGLQSVADGSTVIQAETCDECGSYTKIMAQNRDPAIEPLADDVASVGLDILMKETRYRRAAVNPFLVGY